MATVDIEAPGASEAALKAAIRALVPISTTTISSPVNYVDLALPSGYSAFRMVVTNLVVAGGAAASPYGAFSEDGGVTWLDDWVGFVAYDTTYIRRNEIAFISGHTENGIIDFVLFGYTGGHCMTVDIYPGSATRKAAAVSTLITDGTAAADAMIFARNVCRINTVRVNALRIYPNNDVTGPNDPDPAFTIDSGTVSLYGVL
jgi:hypothetical protein